MNSTFLLKHTTTLDELNDLIKSDGLFLKYKNIRLHIYCIKETTLRIPLIFKKQFIYQFDEGLFISIQNKIYSLIIDDKTNLKLNKLFNPKKINSILYLKTQYQINTSFTFLKNIYRNYIPKQIRYIISFLRILYFYTLFFFSKPKTLLAFQSFSNSDEKIKKKYYLKNLNILMLI